MTDHSDLPGWLVDAQQHRQPLHVTFQNGSTLQYWPQRNGFSKSFAFGDVLDPAFWYEGVVTAPLAGDAKAEESLYPMEALIWAIEWLRLRSGSDTFESFRYGLLNLVSWPDLTHIPDAAVALTARLCALLEHKATAAMLLPRVLGTTDQELASILHLLERTGHLTVNTHDMGHGTKEAAAPTADEAAALAPAPEAQSLLGKLWRKLGAFARGG